MKDEVNLHLANVLPHILGKDYKINAFGLVISLPGTSGQNWHVDSSHLFNPSDFDAAIRDEKLKDVSPCHFVTVFAPLYNYSLDIGPTEIAHGSHKYTNILSNSTVQNQYPDMSICDSILRKEDVTIDYMKCSMGDVGKILQLFYRFSITKILAI